VNGILDAFATHGDKRDKALAYALAMARSAPAWSLSEKALPRMPPRHGDRCTYDQSAGKYDHVYYGRGQVQPTWLKNYDATSTDVGYDLVAYPDKIRDSVCLALSAALMAIDM
jgi:hypothetical protein